MFEQREKIQEVDTSISVILPTKDDGWLLGAQLESILDQMCEEDELILLADGSNKKTRDIISLFEDPRLIKFSNETSIGVNKAVNFCQSKATKRWILGQSGNDLLEPFAFQVFKDVICMFPDSKIMSGHCLGHLRPNWSKKTEYIHPDIFHFLWRTGGWSFHGAGVLLRRDTWGKGYVEELGSFADGFLTWINAMRYGIVHIPYPISAIHADLKSFSTLDWKREEKIGKIEKWIEEFEKPEYDDVRHIGEDLIEMIAQQLSIV